MQRDWGSVFARAPQQAWGTVRPGAGWTEGLCCSRVSKKEGQNELRALLVGCGRMGALGGLGLHCPESGH